MRCSARRERCWLADERANIARQCLEARLLDEIIVHVAPVLVGGGVRLFERDGSDAVPLRFVSSTPEGETPVLHYATT